VAGNSDPSNTSKALGIHMGVLASSYAHMEIVCSGSFSGWIDFKNANTSGTGDYEERIRGGDGNLVFHTNKAERMRIDASGNVGIGTTDPTELLDITAASGTDAFIRLRCSGAVTGESGLKLTESGEYGFQFAHSAATDLLKIRHQNSAGAVDLDDIMVWNPNGNVTVGAGILTNTNKPAFYAWDNSVSRAVTAPLTFNSTTYNTGSHYNTSTSRFLTPVAGTYIFAAVIAHDTANGLASSIFTFYVDGVAHRDITEGMSTHAAHYEQHGTYIIQLNAGQYVDIRARSNPTSITFINGNHGAYYRNCFQGALIG
tara:strand:- start:520 stop:1461 length:942 start_codon:yes stop_codon:yes gene_type:complete